MVDGNSKTQIPDRTNHHLGLVFIHILIGILGKKLWLLTSKRFSKTIGKSFSLGNSISPSDSMSCADRLKLGNQIDIIILVNCMILCLLLKLYSYSILYYSVNCPENS